MKTAVIIAAVLLTLFVVQFIRRRERMIKEFRRNLKPTCVVQITYGGDDLFEVVEVKHDNTVVKLKNLRTEAIFHCSIENVEMP